MQGTPFALACLFFLASSVPLPAQPAPAQPAPAQPVPAQSAPAAPSGNITCSTRRTPPTPADIAYANGEWKGAESLYATDRTKAGEEGDRAHNGYIRSLLHQKRMDDAQTDARAWIAQSPKSAWAQASMAEVSFRKGGMTEAEASLRSTVAGNFCNAQAHSDLAAYLELAGYHAFARTQTDIAHKLDPVDDSITVQWLSLQPRASRASAAGAYLSNANYLNEKQRKSRHYLQEQPAAELATPCTLAAPVSAHVIPLHAIRDRPAIAGQRQEVEWGVVVTINGKQRRLELDTGAPGILLRPAAASGLGLKALAKASINGAGDEGASGVTVRRAETISIGDVQFHDCAVTVLDHDRLITQWDADTPFMEGQDGLIGADILSQFLITINYPEHLLKLDPLPSPPNSPAVAIISPEAPANRFVDPSMASWTGVLRYEHELFIPVRINQGPPRLFLLDTGWGGLPLVMPSAAREVGAMGRFGADGGIGLSGEMKNVVETRPISLHFAGLQTPPEHVLASDIGIDSFGVQIGGVLSQTVLRQLTLQIDYRDQLVKFTYDPSKIKHCIDRVTIEDCYN